MPLAHAPAIRASAASARLEFQRLRKAFPNMRARERD
jgi:hypothetical protein